MQTSLLWVPETAQEKPLAPRVRRAQKRTKQLTTVAILLYRFLSVWCLSRLSRNISLAVYCSSLKKRESGIEVECYITFAGDGVVKWCLNLIHLSGLWVISYSTTPPFSQGLTMSRGQILHFPLWTKDCFVETLP